MTAERSAATVLIIDDDVVLARAFARALTSDGYQVRIARTAEEGLEDVGQCHPDAIFLDFRMPMINGLGFLYRLRRDEPFRKTPVVVVTGDPFLDDEIKEEIRELGAELRVKPIGLKELLTMTRDLVREVSPVQLQHQSLPDARPY